jgi:hypothetical protein
MAMCLPALPVEREPAPIAHLKLAPGDLVLRISYTGVVGLYQSWLTLKREHGSSSFEYFAPAAMIRNGSVRLLTDTTPEIYWEGLWTEMQKDLFDLPGDRRGSKWLGNCRDTKSVGAERVTVESLRGTTYRKTEYYDPWESQCSGAEQLRTALRSLQDVFRGELPQPESTVVPSLVEPTARP